MGAGESVLYDVWGQARSFGSDAPIEFDENGVDAAIARFAARPMPDLEYKAKGIIAWAVDIMGVPEHTLRWSLNPGYQYREKWDGTPDPLVAIAEAIEAGKDFAAESGTGTGKTFFMAICALWFFVCHENGLVVTSAPIEKQLVTMLWKEIGRQWPRFHAHYPTCGYAHLRVFANPQAEDRDAWAIIGWACGVEANKESATRAQGFHAENMMILTEETPGIPIPILTAFQNTLGEGNNLIGSVGNPDHSMDALHVAATSPGVVAIRISVLDHPNFVLDRVVVPGAAGRKAEARRKAKYGENAPMYDSRVRGICPTESVYALIKLEWVRAAQERWKRAMAPNATDEDRRVMQGFPGIGVDVAQSENGDLGVQAEGVGACLLELEAKQCPNATDLGTEVHLRMQRVKCRPEHVGVDPIGPGAATVNELDRLTMASKAVVQRLNGGVPPFKHTQRAPDGEMYDWAPDANQFFNLRAQMHWQFREDLRTGEIALVPDERFTTECITVQWKPVAGLVRVEEKAELKKRLGGKSPDRLDAAINWNWVRRRRTDRLKPKKEDPHTSTRDLARMPHETIDSEEYDDHAQGPAQFLGGGW
jgi:hypothetical protein